METNDFTQFYATKFYCKTCDFVTSRRNDYKRHVLTLKHTRLINANNFTQNYAKLNIFQCECGKKYKHLPSLYKHKKICNNLNICINNEYSIQDQNNIELLTDLVQTQIKENKELRDILKEQHKLMFKIAENVGSNITDRIFHEQCPADDPCE